MVGQRLAGINHSRIALGADEEESPLQSKRSSRFSFLGFMEILDVIHNLLYLLMLCKCFSYFYISIFYV